MAKTPQTDQEYTVKESAPSPLDISDLPPDALLSDKEVASALRISPGNLRNWRLQGRGPSFLRLGRSVRYRVKSLREFLTAQTCEFTTH